MTPDVTISGLGSAARVVIGPRPERRALDTDTIDRAWDELCASNPKYHNGAILAFDSRDGDTIRAHVDEYKRHATRDVANTWVDILSVTCLLSCGEGDTMRAMLGLRAPNTHRYGDLWEFGPAGGVDAPESKRELNAQDLIEEARREAREETGLDLTTVHGEVAALLIDHTVGSADIIVRMNLPEMPAPSTNWEYKAVRWCTGPELRDWAAQRPHTLIPPALAIIEWLGALGG